MRPVIVRRAAVVTATLILLTIPSTFAESVVADHDTLEPGVQDDVDLGTALPGADVPVDVSFVLTCSGTSHLDQGQSLRLTPGIRSIPPGGSYSVGSVVIPAPLGWPADGEPCPAGGLSAIGGPLHMIVTAPPTVGSGYRYSFSWVRSLSPTTPTDAGVLEGSNPTIWFTLDVSDDTPPTLQLPADQVAEATSSSGAVVTFAATAADAEDASPPAVTCTPSSGATFALGTTTVSCEATDDGGNTTRGSFLVTVEDTTGPTIHDLPADIAVTTTNPAGRTVSWPDVTASDLVDPNPGIACSPASGDVFAVRTTRVMCTAIDDAGNTSERSFDVTVTFVKPFAWTATWGEPVATSGSTFLANAGRTVPVKVRIFANGAERTSGNATLSVASCAGTAVLSLPLTWNGGRWNASLDTGLLGGPGCYVATAGLDGNAAGSFRLELRGPDSASGTASRGTYKP